MINFQAFSDEFTKIALARWQKELARGAITLEDLGAHSSQQARMNFAKAPELTGAALDRMRRLAPLKTKAQAAFFSKVPRMNVELYPSPLVVGTTIPTDKGVKVVVGDFAGRRINSPNVETLVHENMKDRLRHAGEHAPSWVRKVIPKRVSSAFAEALANADDVSRFGVLRHELGEAKEVARKQVHAPHASHVGIMPLLEERMAVQGDPVASSGFDRLRQASPEDALATELLHQVGGVGGHLVQPGTRRARALEAAVARKIPQDARKLKMMNEEYGRLPTPSYLGPSM